MEKYFSILVQCPLFYGIGQEDLKAMMACLGAKFTAVSKGDPVFLEGDPAQQVGVVLSGGVQVVQDDYYGNRSVLSILQPGESFGEAFSCAGLDSMPVSVFAIKDSAVLLLNCRRVLLSYLPLSQSVDSEHLKGIGAKKLGIYTKGAVYVSKDHKRKAAGLSF